MVRILLSRGSVTLTKIKKAQHKHPENHAVICCMDDEIKIDASGCWVRKNAQIISATPLSSQSEHYNILASLFDVKDTIVNDKKEEVLSSAKVLNPQA